MRNESGQIEGLYNSGYEITDITINHRRQQLLHKLSRAPHSSDTSTWQEIIDACDPFDRDVALLVAYSASSNDEPDDVCDLKLEGSLGISRSHPVVPQTLNIHDQSNAFTESFRLAKARGGPVLLDMPDGKLPAVLSSGVE